MADIDRQIAFQAEQKKAAIEAGMLVEDEPERETKDGSPPGFSALKQQQNLGDDIF